MGLSAIGRRTAHTLEALGMNVISVRRNATEGVGGARSFLEDMVAQVDHLSLAVVDIQSPPPCLAVEQINTTIELLLDYFHIE